MRHGMRVLRRMRRENRTVTRVQELNAYSARQYESLSTKFSKTRSVRKGTRSVCNWSATTSLFFEQPRSRHVSGGTAEREWLQCVKMARCYDDPAESARPLLSACPLAPVATALIIPAHRELSTCSSRVSIFRRWLLSAAISIPQDDGRRHGALTRGTSCPWTAKIVE